MKSRTNIGKTRLLTGEPGAAVPGVNDVARGLVVFVAVGTAGREMGGNEVQTTRSWVTLSQKRMLTGGKDLR